MENNNVVMTCGGKWVGMAVQLRHAMRQVAALRDGKFLIADATALTPAGCCADGTLLVPPAKHTEFVERLLRLCLDNVVRVVLPHTSLDMPVLTPHVRRFADHGISLLCPNQDIFDLCNDKMLFERFAREEELRYPRSYPAEDLSPADFPVFAKRRRGYGSIGARMYRTITEARDALATCPDLIFQQYIEAPELTVDAFIAADGRCTVRVPRLREQIIGGETVRGHTVRDPAVSALVDRTIAALSRRGLRGPLNVQVFAGTQPWLIEVNTRLGSASVLGNAATNGRYFVSILKYACGEVVDGDPDDYQEGMYLYRYWGDVFHIDGKAVNPNAECRMRNAE